MEDVCDSYRNRLLLLQGTLLLNVGVHVSRQCLHPLLCHTLLATASLTVQGMGTTQ